MKAIVLFGPSPLQRFWKKAKMWKNVMTVEMKCSTLRLPLTCIRLPSTLLRLPSTYLRLPLTYLRLPLTCIRFPSTLLRKRKSNSTFCLQESHQGSLKSFLALQDKANQRVFFPRKKWRPAQIRIRCFIKVSYLKLLLVHMIFTTWVFYFSNKEHIN